MFLTPHKYENVITNFIMYVNIDNTRSRDLLIGVHTHTHIHGLLTLPNHNNCIDQLNVHNWLSVALPFDT